MATKCTNIFQNPAIKNNAEKGRYSDPMIPGMGSPYNKKGCKSSYNQTKVTPPETKPTGGKGVGPKPVNKQTKSQTDTFGPSGTDPNPKVYAGIVKEANSPKEAHCK